MTYLGDFWQDIWGLTSPVWMPRVVISANTTIDQERYARQCSTAFGQRRAEAKRRARLSTQQRRPSKRG